MPHLFSPLTIRSLSLKNRIVVSPMQQYSTPNGKVSDWHLVHLGSRAIGGAGLIIAESTAVSPEGRMTTSDTGIWTDEQAKSWKPIIDFVHQQDSKIALQIGHCGGKASRVHPKEGNKYLEVESGGWQTVSASEVYPIKGAPIPKQLSIEEIDELKKKYVLAVKRAIDVGFDAVEIHAAHGYLFHQFYSQLINKREDNYGGSFENRIRFLIEVIQSIRNEIADSIPLLVRISAVDFSEDEKAWRIEDSVRLSRVLKENGVDVVTASGGGFVQVDKSKVFPSYQVPYAEAIKKENGIITGAVGLITEPKQANEIISTGKADLVLIARESLRDPYFPIHAAHELNQEVEVPFQYKRGFI